MSSIYRLLLADSNTQRCQLLEKHLIALGYTLDVADCAAAAQHILLVRNPDLAIFAADLPDISGVEICRLLRLDGSTLPLILLHAVDSYVERSASLNAGADDALSFPFSLEELAARIKALIRRSRITTHDSHPSEFAYRDLVISTDRRLVSRAGQPIKLTVREYDLLLFLFHHRNHVVPRRKLLSAVWGDLWVGSDNLLDVYIRYLRKKIERDGLEPLIHTVRGVGFRLE